jgi:hypothetical protein
MSEGSYKMDGYEDLVCDLDSAYSETPVGAPGQADQPKELTYVDIDTFLNNS